MRIAYKQGVELVAVGVRHHKVDVGSAHPFGKTVGHGLGQSARVGRPGEHHLGALGLFVLLDGDEVGKGLQRVGSGTLH